MTKKDLKKSRSLEDLTAKTSPSEPKTHITHLEQQLQTVQKQLTNLRTSLGQHDPSLLRRAREELIIIRKRLQDLFPEQTAAKPSELLEQLIIKWKELTDINNELRIDNLQQKDYFTQYQQEQKLTQQLQLQVAKLKKDLTLTQQDLKSAQRVIELRNINLDNDKETSWDYWTWIRIGLLTFLTYLVLNNSQKSEQNHGRPRN